MKKWETLRIIVDEWHEKYRGSKNSFDEGKANILDKIKMEMDDLDRREVKENVGG
jgi:hypothetical protein